MAASSGFNTITTAPSPREKLKKKRLFVETINQGEKAVPVRCCVKGLANTIRSQYTALGIRKPIYKSVWKKKVFYDYYPAFSSHDEYFTYNLFDIRQRLLLRIHQILVLEWPSAER